MQSERRSPDERTTTWHRAYDDARNMLAQKYPLLGQQEAIRRATAIADWADAGMPSPEPTDNTA